MLAPDGHLLNILTAKRALFIFTVFHKSYPPYKPIYFILTLARDIYMSAKPAKMPTAGHFYGGTTRRKHTTSYNMKSLQNNFKEGNNERYETMPLLRGRGKDRRN